MKRARKAIFLAAALLVIIAVSVMGTIAYLTDTGKVTNTFSVGTVKITLDETKVVDGVPDENGVRVENDENTYPLIPGAVYVKDPMITVEKDSEAAYYRMLVTINCMENLNKIFEDGFLPEDFVDGWDSAVWPCVKITDNGDDTATYEFRYAGAEPNFENGHFPLEPLFTELEVPSFFNNYEVEMLQGFQIEIVGHAIQKTGFEDENAAWVAFDQQHPATTAINTNSDDGVVSEGEQQLNP